MHHFRTLRHEDAWKVAEGAGYLTCDKIESLCASYVIHSPSRKEIIVVFRGTKTKEQLLLEGWQSFKPGVEFYDWGKVTGKALKNKKQLIRANLGKFEI